MLTGIIKLIDWNDADTDDYGFMRNFPVPWSQLYNSLVSVD